MPNYSLHITAEWSVSQVLRFVCYWVNEAFPLHLVWILCLTKLFLQCPTLHAFSAPIANE